MSTNTTANNNGSKGISFLGAFFLVMFTLKVIGELDLSWWWITAPLWGGFLILFLAAFLGALGKALATDKTKARK